MKKEFRKNVIKLRKSKDLNFVTYNSDLITKKLLSIECIKKSTNIMLYLDFNNEVKTDYLILKLLESNKIVSTPITYIEDRKLIPHKITNLYSDLVIGPYKIREPNPTNCLPISIESIDVVIVPAVAYDKKGYRLGYGGGFYDRFLSKLRKDSIKIGIAFDFQIFENIPKEEHDAKLDYIVSESEIISTNYKNN